MAAMTEALNGHVASYGRDCKDYMPQDIKTVASKLYEAVMQTPNLGADLEGYHELTVALQAALMPRK